MENKKFIEMNTPTRNHMNGGSAKLSLMARYDDLCRHNNSLILKEIDEVESSYFEYFINAYYFFIFFYRHHIFNKEF